MVILTTSNITEKIDLAFVDRADIKQYIGPPSQGGIFNIYVSCIEELMKVKTSDIYELRLTKIKTYIGNETHNTKTVVFLF